MADRLTLARVIELAACANPGPYVGDLARMVLDLHDWIKCANQFMWAHEHDCPRSKEDAPCSCGLDQFLGRPRPFLESYRAQVADLTAEKLERSERVAALIEELDASLEKS